MSYYLGISYSGMHDSNVSVLNSHGDILFATSEERFSRIKKDGRWPRLSIDYIKKNVLSGRSVDYVYVPFSDPAIKISENIVLGSLLQKRRIALPLGYGVYNIDWEKRFIRSFRGSKIKYMGHHMSHAISGYYLSGFKKAMIITCDNGCYNEPWIMTILGVNNKKISTIERFSKNFYHSPAQSYSLITAILGFRPGKDEGKITGLSAQGKFNKECISAIKKIIYDSNSDNLMSWEGKFNDKKVPIYKVDQVFKNKLYRKISNFTREDIAFGVQYLVEREIIKVVSYYKKLNKYKNIVLSGGIFANVRLNQKIFALGFEKIFIDPAMSDEGLSLGAALSGCLYNKNLKRERNIKNIYFGPEINGESFLFKKYNIKSLYFNSDSKLADEISRILASGKTIAIARGKMEYGPRALGNRSILASPVASDINNNLNKKLGRNDFMPFAPVVLDKNMYRCFSDMRGKELASKYMTITSYATKYFIKKCPQIIHVDKTARPQIITRRFNSFYYLILNSFYKLTGIPSLINTSFNIHNQPIVCSAEDALANFFSAELDYLLLNRHLVSFSDNINRKFIFTNIR